MIKIFATKINKIAKQKTIKNGTLIKEYRH